ncbi:coenzyme gamma-F420-2:alpha-L-glutamate ligase [Methanotorris igneus]|uniref:Coenzyme gamma-F420-2:alpha-L-glutamate ligase n=1 Tax=Methanotorris igneus (strain DSM 5666 / JCM 11834 / Kol 5) TaxID=880724 RepID=F6BE48_METIK|nr:coenzyme gamma-F420-2:alpha-L-glutamate ligase [Methanotorris igneus]AEF95584.1 alpha-L-glutamate ligase, RimK family [Methanotorris igneus Kol 5]
MVKITIISAEGGSTIRALKNAIEKLGEKCEVFLLSDDNFLLDSGFNLESDLIHTRCGIGDYLDKLTLYSWQFLNALEAEGHLFINPLKTVYASSDKFKTIKILEKNKIPIPKTALIRDYDDAVKFMEKNNIDFPVVLKNSFSKCGLKTYLAKNHEELKKLTKNAIWESKLIQEFIDFKESGVYKDIRVLVVDGEVVGGYRRVSKDFRTNLHLSQGCVEKLQLNEEIEEIALKCAEVMNGYIMGVDILPKNGEYYVIEVNSAPGTKGFRQIGINADEKIAKCLIKYARR